MRAVVDVNGIGYEISIPLSTFEKLPVLGAHVKILTHLQIRDTEHLLFGFFTTEERDLFKLLIHHVSGVGPKLALAFLSGCTTEQLKSAVVRGDTAFLSRMKGVGKKTAERVVVELRDKVGVSQAWATAASATTLSPEQQKQNDALLALIALGYNQADALKALKEVPISNAEEMVREALKRI